MEPSAPEARPWGPPAVLPKASELTVPGSLPLAIPSRSLLAPAQTFTWFLFLPYLWISRAEHGQCGRREAGPHPTKPAGAPAWLWEVLLEY